MLSWRLVPWCSFLLASAPLTDWQLQSELQIELEASSQAAGSPYLRDVRSNINLEVGPVHDTGSRSLPNFRGHVGCSTNSRDACRARAGGDRYFGVQASGECWSGSDWARAIVYNYWPGGCGVCGGSWCNYIYTAARAIEFYGAARSAFMDQDVWDLGGSTAHVTVSQAGFMVPQRYTHAYWLYWRQSDSGWRSLFRGTSDHCVLVEAGSKRLGFYSNRAGGFFPLDSGAAIA